MKRILLFLSLSLSPYFLLAQNIQNTIWKTYNTGLTDTIKIVITKNRVNQYDGNEALLVSSFYKQNDDTVKIVDISGPLACQDNDTGIYRFTVINDTLTLYLLEDNCFLRSFNYDGAEAWKVYDFNAVDEKSAKSDEFTFYPNPNSGSIGIEAPSSGNLEIYNQSGQLIERLFVPMGIKRLSLNLDRGMYFLRFIGPENIQGDKMVVE